MQAYVHKKVEYKNVVITVEEVPNGQFITAIWNKDVEQQYDRRVLCSETFGGAMEVAFDLLSEIIGL